MNRSGRKLTVVSGSVMVGISMTAYAGIIYLGDWGFLIMSFALRIFQGIGNTGISTAAFAAATDYDQTLAEKLVGYIEISSCLGIATGPAVGTAFYNWVGFIGPFVFVGFLMFIISPFLCFFIKSKSSGGKECQTPLIPDSPTMRCVSPYSQNQLQQITKHKQDKVFSEPDAIFQKHDQGFTMMSQAYSEGHDMQGRFSPIEFNHYKQGQNQQTKQKPKNVKNLTFIRSLIIGRVLLDGSVIIVTLAGVFMLEPVLYQRFTEYNLSNTMIGVVFSANAFCYAICIPFLGFLPSWLDRRAVIGPACLLVSFSYIMIGPIFLPQYIEIMITGLMIQGSAISFALIPAIPDMMLGAKEAYPFEKEEVISNYIGGNLNLFTFIGITNFVLNGAKVIGPPFGGLIMDLTGSFIKLCFIFGCIQLIVSLLFVLFNNPCAAYGTCKGTETKGTDTELQVANK